MTPSSSSNLNSSTPSPDHQPYASVRHLWRTKKFSWSSSDWELVSDKYKIGKHYEYDDGVKVDGTYYVYEQGKVYTFSGPLEKASGKWKVAGTFPNKQCDDIGVYYEDGLFHIFGEHGHFRMDQRNQPRPFYFQNRSG